MHKSSKAKTYHAKGVFEKILKSFSLLSLFYNGGGILYGHHVWFRRGSRECTSFNLSLIFSVFSTGISISPY